MNKLTKLSMQYKYKSIIFIKGSTNKKRNKVSAFLILIKINTI